MYNAATKMEPVKLTYDDYLAIDDGKRHELIDGVIYDLAAPIDAHQAIVLELGAQLRNYLKGKTCIVRVSPYDVKLSERNVVQPDVLIICDRKKIDPKKGCIGAPDYIAEVTSPSTSSIDSLRKFNLYREFGVREYWIIHPDTKLIQVSMLDNGRYYTDAFGAENKTVKVNILDDCEIDVESLFSYEQLYEVEAAADSDTEADNESDINIK
ncbi:hypothetical protein FACS1894184_01550 [Clostridia bacterium]|nr:hypothetical protein FACS1894184_01550 [Clostridia bacterium]